MKSASLWVVALAVAIFIFNLPNLAETWGKWLPIIAAANTELVAFSSSVASLCPPAPPTFGGLWSYWPLYAVLGISMVLVLAMMGLMALFGRGLLVRLWITLAFFTAITLVSDTTIYAEMTGNSFGDSLFKAWFSRYEGVSDQSTFFFRSQIQGLVIEALVCVCWLLMWIVSLWRRFEKQAA